MQKWQSEQRHSRHMAGARAAEHTKEHSLTVVSPRTSDLQASDAEAGAGAMPLSAFGGTTSGAFGKPAADAWLEAS